MSKNRPKPPPQPANPLPDIEISADPDADRLSGAFDGDDSSFTETMTGIVADIGDKLTGKGKDKPKKTKAAPAPEATPAAEPAPRAGGLPGQGVLRSRLQLPSP